MGCGRTSVWIVRVAQMISSATIRDRLQRKRLVEEF
jgi:hypothetical protein